MGRPAKKEINLSKESILSLMQEIYNELVEQRNTAIRIQNKMLSLMKEVEDMTLIGPIIEKQQKIIKTAYNYLYNSFSNIPISYRFDVVSCSGPLNRIKIDWIIGAFY